MNSLNNNRNPAASDFTEKSGTPFSVRFGGATTIDAELFAQIMSDLIVLGEETARIGVPNCELKLEIISSKEGSFRTYLKPIIKIVGGLITGDPDKAISGITAFFEFKKHCEGRPPKNITPGNAGDVVENHAGQVREFPRGIMNNFNFNIHINNALVSIGDRLRQSHRTSFEIENEQGKTTIRKKDFPYISAPIAEVSVPENTATQTRVDTVILSPKKPDLLGDSQWEFVRKGKTFSAKIEDKRFVDKVHKGDVILYAGIKISCRLRTEYQLDGAGNRVYEKEKYTVLEVRNIESPSKTRQSALF